MTDPTPAVPAVVTALAPVWTAACVAAVGIVGHRRLTDTPRSLVARSTMGVHRRRRVRPLALAGALVAAIVALGPTVALVAIAGALAVRRYRPIRLARRRRRQIEHDLPGALDLLVLSVRAGLTPRQAVGQLGPTIAGPVGDAFEEVTRRTERGQPFADALDAMGELLGTRARGVADVIATGDRHGLPLGPTLDQLALEARAARQRLEGAEARKLPVRLAFPLVFCTLPSFVLLAIVPALIATLSSLGATNR